MELKVNALELNSVFKPRSFNKKTVFICTMIVSYFIISSWIPLVASKPAIYYHGAPFTSSQLRMARSIRSRRVSKAPSKLSVTEALGCNVGLTRSAFMYLDNICHRCFNLFREIEIYYMCR